MDDEKVTQVFTVRNRPVGFQSGRWGGALVAVERGEFPVSSTGYRSLCGVAASAVTADFLEQLARAHERERESLLQRLREGRKQVGDPIGNYIHVSGAYEQAVQYGFFASDRDRAALWAGAHQLLCLVDSDQRFQPAPDRSYVAWTEEHCAGSLVRARELKTLLARLAAGDFPAELPIRLLGVHAYLALAPKPGGEPKIELGGYTAEMALNLPAMSAGPSQTWRSRSKGEEQQTAHGVTQLGLFDAPSVATRGKPKAGIRLQAGNF